MIELEETFMEDQQRLLNKIFTKRGDSDTTSTILHIRTKDV